MQRGREAGRKGDPGHPLGAAWGSVPALPGGISEGFCCAAPHGGAEGPRGGRAPPGPGPWGSGPAARGWGHRGEQGAPGAHPWDAPGLTSPAQPSPAPAAPRDPRLGPQPPRPVCGPRTDSPPAQPIREAARSPSAGQSRGSGRAGGEQGAGRGSRPVRTLPRPGARRAARGRLPGPAQRAAGGSAGARDAGAPPGPPCGAGRGPGPPRLCHLPAAARGAPPDGTGRERAVATGGRGRGREALGGGRVAAGARGSAPVARRRAPGRARVRGGTRVCAAGGGEPQPAGVSARVRLQARTPGSGGSGDPRDPRGSVSGCAGPPPRSGRSCPYLGISAPANQRGGAGPDPPRPARTPPAPPGPARCRRSPLRCPLRCRRAMSSSQFNKGPSYGLSAEVKNRVSRGGGRGGPGPPGGGERGGSGVTGKRGGSVPRERPGCARGSWRAGGGPDATGGRRAEKFRGGVPTPPGGREPGGREDGEPRGAEGARSRYEGALTLPAGSREGSGGAPGPRLPPAERAEGERGTRCLRRDSSLPAAPTCLGGTAPGAGGQCWVPQAPPIPTSGTGVLPRGTQKPPPHPCAPLLGRALGVAAAPAPCRDVVAATGGTGLCPAW